MVDNSIHSFRQEAEIDAVKLDGSQSNGCFAEKTENRMTVCTGSSEFNLSKNWKAISSKHLDILRLAGFLILKVWRCVQSICSMHISIFVFAPSLSGDDSRSTDVFCNLLHSSDMNGPGTSKESSSDSSTPKK